MLKTYQFKTHCKGDSHSSKTANIIFARTHDKTKVCPNGCKRNGIQIHWTAFMLVERTHLT